MDDMLFQPLAAVELAATQAQVALNHDNGVTTASEGMEKNDRWKYNGEWYNRVQFIEKNTRALSEGAFNRVYEISTATATKLGMFDKAWARRSSLSTSTPNSSSVSTFTPRRLSSST